MPFQSPRFAGDPLLEACLANTHRLMVGQSGEAVRKIQQALIDLGYQIPDGATGNFGQQTANAVVHFKTIKGLQPNDPVIGPGTSHALDIDIVARDAGRAVPQPPPAPLLTRMVSGFNYSGEGAGVGVAFFRFWLHRNGHWRGYTAASNQGIVGFAVLMAPAVAFMGPNHPRLDNLHGSIVDISIKASQFVKDGGHATISMRVRTNTPDEPTMTYHADHVQGVCAVVGEIAFSTTLVELPADEWDPTC